MRRIIRGVFTLFREHKGIGLIETLAAMGILGVIGGVFIYALSTGFLTGGQVNQFAMEERLARTQLEDIRNAPYDDTAPIEYPTVDQPADYSISVDVEPNWGNTCQTITVSIYRKGAVVFKLKTLKAKGL